MSHIIYPTHDCFTNALQALEEIAKTEPAHQSLTDGTLILIHALCKHPGGDLFAHAWLEDRLTRTAIFKGILDGEGQYFAAPIEEFYAELKPTEITEYTPMQAVVENYRTGMCGPWKEVYRDYLRKTGDTEHVA